MRKVKVPEGRAIQSDPYRGASNLAGRSGSEPVKPRNGEARAERIAGILGVPSRWSNGEGHVGIEVLEHIDTDSQGSERTACQEGMCSESSEPLAGRLGAPAQRRHRV